MPLARSGPSKCHPNLLSLLANTQIQQNTRAPLVAAPRLRNRCRTVSDSLRWEWCQRQPVCLQDFPLRSQVDGILANLLGYLTLCIYDTSISVILRPPHELDLELRGRLIRSLGALREMLPGSFVERQRACGRPSCHCADGKRLHPQYQISVLIDGKPKALNIPAEWVDQVREKIAMRRRFEAAAATICKLNLKRFLKEKEDRQV